MIGYRQFGGNHRKGDWMLDIGERKIVCINNYEIRCEGACFYMIVVVVVL